MILIVFCSLKAEYLPLPFFWDEAWVYGNAVRLFADLGPGLLPDAQTIDLTRGHPMLFHFIYALWGKIVSHSVLSMHILSLLITLSIFGFLYKTSIWLGSRYIAIFAVTYLISNEIFFVQSSLVLPEVLLAITMFLSIYYYSTNKVVAFIIFTSLAFYVKESAIVLIPLYLVTSLLSSYFKKKTPPIPKLWTLVFPIAIASFHYIYQKFTFGWYFYPLHVNYIAIEFNTIKNLFAAYSNEIFIKDYTWIISLIYTLSFVINTDKEGKFTIRRISYGLIVMTALLLILSVFKAQFILYFSIAFILMNLYFAFNNLNSNNTKSFFLFSLWIFIAGFIAFSSLNFYTVRYCIPVILAYSVALGIQFHLLTAKHQLARISLAPVLFVILLISGNRHHIMSDTDTAYKYGVKVHQEMIEHLDHNYTQETAIGSGFLETMALTNYRTGYVKDNDHEYKDVKGLDKNDRQIKILSDIEGTILDKEYYIDDSWEMVKSISNKRALVEIYEKKEFSIPIPE